MKNRVFSLLLVLALVICLIPATVLADDSGLVITYLKEDHKGFAGSNSDGLDTFPLTCLGGVTNTDPADPTADFSYWHFVDSSCTAQYAVVTFLTGSGETVEATICPFKNDQHFAVVTPSGWQLSGGYCASRAAGQFNLSHSYRHEPSMGKVTVTAAVDQYYYEYTNHEDYIHNVENIYWQYSHDCYERDVTEILKHVEQDRYIPTFQKKVNAITGTLVTRLNYDGKSNPTNGGAFKNGHTYVKVNVAEAEQGVSYTIADSSRKTGKKASDQFNRPINYQYQVKITDGKLTVSFDDRLVYASVGAYVVSDPSKFPGHAPAHWGNQVTVNLPANCGEYVYLYTHIETLKWYPEEVEYVFAGWEYFDTVISEDYESDGLVYGEYEYVGTEYDEPEYQQTLEDTVLVNAWQTSEKHAVEYTGALTLTVNGEVKPMNESFLLEPGEYEFVLSGEGFDPISKTVVIAAGDVINVDFGTIDIHLADRDFTNEEIDVTVTENEFDTIVPQVGEARYADRETVVEKVEDSYIKGEDIFLGDDKDPFGEYAKLL